MEIRFKINLCGRDMFINVTQLAQLHRALEGSDVGDTTYKGTGKGFYGTECQYDIKFERFSPGKHLNVSISTSEEIDALKTMIAMRNKETE